MQAFFRSLDLVGHNEVFIPEFFPTSVRGSLAFLAIFGFIRAVIYIFKDYFTGITNQAFIRHQRGNITEYAFLQADKLSKYEVTTVFNERVNHSGGLILHITNIIHTVTTSTLLLLYGLKLAPLELIFGLLLIGILLLPLRLLDKKLKELGLRLVKESADSNKTLLLGLQNNFFLKLYNLLDIELTKEKATLKNYEDCFKKHHIVSSLKNAVPMFGGLLIVAGIAWLSIFYTHLPKMKLLSFFYIFIRLSQSMGLMAHTIANMRLHWEGFRNLYEWHINLKKLKARTLRKKAQNKISKMDLKNVWSNENISIYAECLSFGYNKKKRLFKDLSFNLNKGDVFLIRGPSGTGKSTLIKLITGLDKPCDGSISINGHSTSSLLTILRDHIAYVGPEPYLVPGTVKENLVYGQNVIDNHEDEDMWEALKKAMLKNTIKGLPNALEEELNEQTQLSTGEKQRISIARAFLKKPKILILDEATANLDIPTEKRIIEQLDQMSKDLITIIISHKDSFNTISSKTLSMN